jgi:hypothetical protein
MTQVAKRHSTGSTPGHRGRIELPPGPAPGRLR